MRFDDFDDSELDELIISLDHRLAEAKAGNAYVYTDIVESLLSDARTTEDNRRRVLSQ